LKAKFHVVLFITVSTVYTKFVLKMAPCNKVVYWTVHQTLLNEALPIAGFLLELLLDNVLLYVLLALFSSMAVL